MKFLLDVCASSRALRVLLADLGHDVLDGDGCTLVDRLDACAAQAKNHGHYVACVAQKALRFYRQGLITGKDKGKLLVVCAAQADIPEGSVSHHQKKKSSPRQHHGSHER